MIVERQPAFPPQPAHTDIWTKMKQLQRGIFNILHLIFYHSKPACIETFTECKDHYENMSDF